MPNDSFAFKKFTIKQDKCAMKVGTDGVLLGAWVNTKNAKHILDVGTGTGLIALMMAQKSNDDVIIDAVDIDEQAYNQAIENVKNSSWANRINIYHTPFQYFADQKKEYDLIVSNPPYFISSTKAPEDQRNYARHTDLLDYDELLFGVLKLLAPQGAFCVILPSKEGELFRDMAEKNGLFLTKLMRVKTREDKVEKRYIMRFEKTRNSFSEESIIIEKDERQSYTEEYKSLTKDFYLAF